MKGKTNTKRHNPIRCMLPKPTPHSKQQYEKYKKRVTSGVSSVNASNKAISSNTPKSKQRFPKEIFVPHSASTPGTQKDKIISLKSIKTLRDPKHPTNAQPILYPVQDINKLFHAKLPPIEPSLTSRSRPNSMQVVGVDLECKFRTLCAPSVKLMNSGANFQTNNFTPRISNVRTGDDSSPMQRTIHSTQARKIKVLLPKDFVTPTSKQTKRQAHSKIIFSSMMFKPEPNNSTNIKIFKLPKNFITKIDKEKEEICDVTFGS